MSAIAAKTPGVLSGIFSFSRAGPALDAIALGLIFILVLLSVSWWAVARRKALRLHKALQITEASLLAVLLGAFEVQVRLFGWRDAAEVSPHYETWVQPVLVLHLLCAVPCAVLWLVTLTGALRHFPKPVKSSEYAARHRVFGRLTAWSTIATAVTGWLFYWLAFVS